MMIQIIAVGSIKVKFQPCRITVQSNTPNWYVKIEFIQMVYFLRYRHLASLIR